MLRPVHENVSASMLANTYQRTGQADREAGDDARNEEHIHTPGTMLYRFLCDCETGLWQQKDDTVHQISGE